MVREKILHPDGRWRKPEVPIKKLKPYKSIVLSNARCLYCNTFKGLTLDHKMPKSRGGTNDLSNLQPLCKYCNGKKGSYTDIEVALTFKDIRSRGVWYEWEKPFKRWLDWLDIVFPDNNW